MVIKMEIPKVFESHFMKDRFGDSFARVLSELKRLEHDYLLCSNYEIETLKMLAVSLAKAEIEEDRIGK